MQLSLSQDQTSRYEEIFSLRKSLPLRLQLNLRRNFVKKQFLKRPQPSSSSRTRPALAQSKQVRIDSSNVRSDVFLPGMRFEFTPDINNNLIKINHRYGGECLVIGHNLVLLGGRILTTANFLISFFDLSTRSVQNKLEFQRLPNCGFSADRIGDNVYLFGGYVSVLSIRECKKSMLMFSGSTIVEVQTKNSSVVTPRRNHSHSIYQNFIIYSGGINTAQQYLSDILSFEVTKKKWSSFKRNKKNPLFWQPLAGHKTEIYTNSEGEHVLLRFGGCNSQDNYLGLATIRFEERNGQLQFDSEWTQPATSGVPASSRMQHTMHFLSKIRVLIIIGGRNNVDYYGINQLSLLEVDHFTWFRLNIVGSPFDKIYGHSSAFDGDSNFFIFGGFIYSESTDECYGSNRVSKIGIRFRNVSDSLSEQVSRHKRKKMHEERHQFEERRKKVVYSLNSLIQTVYNAR